MTLLNRNCKTSFNFVEELGEYSANIRPHQYEDGQEDAVDMTSPEEEEDSDMLLEPRDTFSGHVLDLRLGERRLLLVGYQGGYDQHKWGVFLRMGSPSKVNASFFPKWLASGTS